MNSKTIGQVTVVFFILLTFSSVPISAQFKSIQTDDLNLLYYDFGHEFLVNHTLRCYTNAINFHRRVFGYNSDEPVTIIMQDFGDFGNAGASAVPRNVVLMGIAPFNYAYETNPANERINVLANHELVHIVALDMASKSDQSFRNIFMGKIDPVQDEPISMLYGYLTTPRRYSPRWYHEGIAEFMTTWMSGGIGRVLGPYDEMRFRTMVRDDDYIYDAIGLESEGTTVDFEVGSNSYMYGTRFMSYLALQYGPESLIEWVARKDGTKRYYASQFRNVYGVSLDKEWGNWIEWEKNWQNENLSRIRNNPVTVGQPLSNMPLGGVSRPVFDESNNRIYAAIAYPGQVAHIAEINPENGTTRRIVDIEGPALHFVSSLAFDKENRVLFYTNDNNSWRDLMSVNLNTGKVTRHIKDSRTGDLVFNAIDNSLWGVRHLNGIASIVRIPHPYTDWNLIHTMPYGEDVYDLDISPDGLLLTAAIADVGGNQKLVMTNIEDLMSRRFEYETIGNFEENSPASFVFSSDGKFMYGSTYYTGVSNIVRYDLTAKKLEWLTNAETGMFKPVPVWQDSLIAFEYTGRGFIPVKIVNEPIGRVSAIRFLGNEIARNHPIVTEWIAPAPSPRTIDVDTLIRLRTEYIPAKEMNLNGVYPIVQGYKDYIAGGVRLDFADPLRLQKMHLSLSYSPDPALTASERLHASWNYEFVSWRLFASYNAGNFYDLFGPTKRSRKGHSAGVGYSKNLLYAVPRVSDFNTSLTYYGGLERLPEFQNITTSFERFLGYSANISYSNTLHSLGAVDHEKGIRWSMGFYSNVVLEDMLNQRVIFPRIHHNLDYGIALPIKHSSIWLRSSVGYSFSPNREPLGNFYFGGFGNNWIDYLGSRRYRDFYTFPGADINAINGTNFTKLLVEWTTPPVRFRRFGFMSLYSNWSQLNFFTSGIITNLDQDAQLKDRFYNAGAQLDFKLVLFSVLDATMSFGYASAWDYDNSGIRSDELMISLRILR